jgi:hypothetical protein
MIDWNKIEQEFNSFEEGDVIVDDNGDKYLKPIQSIPHHLDGNVISLKDGSIIHFSRINGFHRSSKLMKSSL